MADSRRVDVDEAFQCKIMQSVCDSPVITPTGHLYGEMAIKYHLKDKHFDPYDKAPLAEKDLRKDNIVEKLITHYAAQGTIKNINPDVPDELICPLTGSIFVEPVVAADGNTYEREALFDHLNNHNNTLPNSDITDNPNFYDKKQYNYKSLAVANLIEKYYPEALKDAKSELNANKTKQAPIKLLFLNIKDMLEAMKRIVDNWSVQDKNTFLGSTPIPVIGPVIGALGATIQKEFEQSTNKVINHPDINDLKKLLADVNKIHNDPIKILTAAITILKHGVKWNENENTTAANFFKKYLKQCEDFRQQYNSLLPKRPAKAAPPIPLDTSRIEDDFQIVNANSVEGKSPSSSSSSSTSPLMQHSLVKPPRPQTPAPDNKKNAAPPRPSKPAPGGDNNADSNTPPSPKGPGSGSSTT